MKTYAVYFTPCGSLATWPLASDTLFGSVCWGIRWLGLMSDKELADWLENHRMNPPFAFSHAFPVWFQSQEPIRFYPRPATFRLADRDFDDLASSLRARAKITLKSAKVEVVSVAKRLKNVSFISERILSDITTTGLKAGNILQNLLLKQNTFSIKGQLLCTATENHLLPNIIFASEAMQHNQIDRLAGATVEGMLFYREETFFAKGGGLWAILAAEEEDMKRYLQPALHYLADTGFGADRTVGKGQFAIHCEEFSLPLKTAHKTSMMTLSHYLPLPEEINLQAQPLAYTLKVLRPKREQKYLPSGLTEQTTSPIYKLAVQVFEPGSVFALQREKNIYGQLARLTPPDDTPIYQSGAAIMVTL
jgi:CRISPR type III-A-associated RAMP protein Csm4